MGKKLYVGSLPFKATENDLTSLFSKFGNVESVKIITDAYSGQSKGFGFVEMGTNEDAEKAIKELNGSSFMERSLIVNEARPKESRERTGGFGGRGGAGGGRGGRDSSGGRGGYRR